MEDALKKELEQDIKDVILKVLNIQNLLCDGKEIPAYNKLVGLNQKLQYMRQKLNANNSDQPIQEST